MGPRRLCRRRKTNQKKKTDRYEENSDKEFVVEAILDEKPDDTVLVKWEGYDEATWEPADAIPASLIKRFRQSKTRAQAVPKSSIQQRRPDVGKSDDGRSDADDVESSGRPSSPGKLGSGSRSSQKRKRVLVDKSDSDDSDYVVEEASSEDGLDESLLTRNPNATKKVNRLLNLDSKPKAVEKVNRSLDAQVARSVCVVCEEVEMGGRKCATCMKPVHHMCSNELSHALGVEEFGETCYCSSSCYQASRVKPKRIPGTPINKKVQQKRASKMTSCDGTKVDVIGRRVAFSPEEEEWMPSRLYSEIGSLYLVGLVTRPKKKRNGQEVPDEFEIRWTISQYQSSSHVHYISWGKVKEGVANYDIMRGTTMIKESWESLCMSNDSGSLKEEMWDAFEEVDDTYVRYEHPSSVPMDLEEVEQVQNLDFQPDV
jgi:hypothetical protein